MTSRDPRGLLALLAKDDLLRIVAALALDVDETAEIARVSELPATRVDRALRTLETAGLARATDGRWLLERDRFAQALRRASARPQPAGDVPAPIRPFFQGVRLREIPAQHAKRLILLRYLADRFAPGREYREAEVNAILRQAHEDYASLRRYLVDERLLTRSRGVYRRV